MFIFDSGFSDGGAFTDRNSLVGGFLSHIDFCLLGVES